jgi:predicted transcriptional regulator
MIKLAKGAVNEGETIKSAVKTEFKQEAVRLVKSVQPAMQVALTLGMPHRTLNHCLRADKLGQRA